MSVPTAINHIRYTKLSYVELLVVLEDVVLVIILVESSFNPLASGSSQEYGLMQLIPNLGLDHTNFQPAWRVGLAESGG